VSAGCHSRLRDEPPTAAFTGPGELNHEQNAESGIRAAIDDFGGSFVMEFETVLITAKRLE